MTGLPRKSRDAIDAPHLAKNLPVAEFALPDDFPNEDTLEQCEVQDFDLSEQARYRLHLDGVLFSRVNLAQTKFDTTRIEDTRFAGSNLSNAVWPKLSCARVEFTACRMTGFIALESLFHDTRFSDCKADLAQFYAAKMRAARFERCPLNGADFRTADLTGVKFLECDLSNADFTGATLRGADLRGCTIEGARIGPKELTGAKIDERQALALVRSMGIIIE